MRVMVLGAGIAGLLAAWGARQEGCEVAVYAAERKFQQHLGVRYLHDPCGLVLPSSVIRNYLVGTPEGYAKKVYGSSQVRTSAHALVPVEVGWDATEALRQLRELFPVKERQVSSLAKVEWLRAVEGVDLVVSSIPLPQLCPELEYFSSISWARTMGVSGTESFVIYNGLAEDLTTRTSLVFGAFARESVQPFAGDRVMTRVIGKTSEPEIPPWLLLVGRTGKWEKGYLAHQAYYDCLDKIEVMRSES